MSKNLRMAIVTIIAIAGIIFIYRALFIKTVNYNIGGIDIPARYNVLTGKAVPIANYNGKPLTKTIAGLNNDKIGMDSDGVTAAHFRWALFEEWVKSQPQYKGWESDPDIFKKANNEFKEKIPSNVKVLK